MLNYPIPRWFPYLIFISQLISLMKLVFETYSWNFYPTFSESVLRSYYPVIILPPTGHYPTPLISVNLCNPDAIYYLTSITLLAKLAPEIGNLIGLHAFNGAVCTAFELIFLMSGCSYAYLSDLDAIFSFILHPTAAVLKIHWHIKHSASLFISPWLDLTFKSVRIFEVLSVCLWVGWWWMMSVCRICRLS